MKGKGEGGKTSYGLIGRNSQWDSLSQMIHLCLAEGEMGGGQWISGVWDTEKEAVGGSYLTF